MFLGILGASLETTTICSFKVSFVVVGIVRIVRRVVRSPFIIVHRVSSTFTHRVSMFIVSSVILAIVHRSW